MNDDDGFLKIFEFSHQKLNPKQYCSHVSFGLFKNEQNIQTHKSQSRPVLFSETRKKRAHSFDLASGWCARQRRERERERETSFLFFSFVCGA